MAKEITDFGEKIGGARKDLIEFRKNGGFSVNDIKDWSDVDREKYITKKEVFLVPDFQKMVDEQGYDREAAFYIKKVRDALPAQPCLDFAKMAYYRSGNNEDVLKSEISKAQEQYITALNAIKEKLMAVKEKSDIRNCGNDLFKAFKHDDIEVVRCFNQKAFNKTLNTAMMSSWKFEREFKKAEFLFSPDEQLMKDIAILKYNGENVKREADRFNGHEYISIKNGGSTYFLYREEEQFQDMNNWKADTYFARRENVSTKSIIGNNFATPEEAKAFALEYMKAVKEKETQKNGGTTAKKTKLTPPQLAHIERIGEDFRDGYNVNGEDMMKTFGFRGGEFGNWENQIDRQANLNMSFEAFKDLSKALDMSDKDVSLGGNLAIAYGARGRGNALAHFEAGANVINLTKMRGAGSLGHEWGHALDFYIARKTGLSTVFATDARNAITEDIVKAMKFTTLPDGNVTYTQYYKDAQKIDTLHSKSDKGYWQSNVELFARAFATYIMDKLSPDRSDYLCGHAEFAPVYYEDNLYYTYPRGEERIAINKAFDKLFEELRERGLINERQPENEHKLIHQQDGVDINKYQENKEKITEAFKNNDTPEITDWSQLSFDFEETSAESVEKSAEQTESIEQEIIEQPTESVEAETESRQNSFQSSVVALLNEAVNDNFPEMDDNARERIQEMIKNTALQLSLAVNDELNNDKIAEFARTAYSPISFENVPVQDVDGMEYNVELTGKDFYEALGRAVEHSEDLKYLVDKAGGVTAFRTNENTSIGFSAVKDDFIEDEIYFSCEVNSNKTTLSVPIPLDIDETKALIDKINEQEEKTVKIEKKRTAAERDI